MACSSLRVICLLATCTLPGGAPANLSLQRSPLDVTRAARSILAARVTDEIENQVHSGPGSSAVTSHGGLVTSHGGLVTSHGGLVTSHGGPVTSRTDNGPRPEEALPHVTSLAALRRSRRSLVPRQTLRGSTGFAMFNGHQFDIRPYQGIVPRAGQPTNQRRPFTSSANHRSRYTGPTNQNSRQQLVSANHNASPSGGSTFGRQSLLSALRNIGNQPTRRPFFPPSTGLGGGSVSRRVVGFPTPVSSHVTGPQSHVTTPVSSHVTGPQSHVTTPVSSHVTGPQSHTTRPVSSHVTGPQSHTARPVFSHQGAPQSHMTRPVFSHPGAPQSHMTRPAFSHQGGPQSHIPTPVSSHVTGPQSHVTTPVSSHVTGPQSHTTRPVSSHVTGPQSHTARPVFSHQGAPQSHMTRPVFSHPGAPQSQTTRPVFSHPQSHVTTSRRVIGGQPGGQQIHQLHTTGTSSQSGGQTSSQSGGQTSSLSGMPAGLSVTSHGLAAHSPPNARNMETFLIQRSHRPGTFVDGTAGTGTLLSSRAGRCPVVDQSGCPPLPRAPLPPSCSNDFQCHEPNTKCCYDPCLTLSKCVRPVGF